MNELKINGIWIKKGNYSDGVVRFSQLGGYVFDSPARRPKTCFHCNRIKFSTDSPFWTIKHPTSHTILAKVFQTTSIFQYAFNVILGKHYTGNSLLEILRYGHIFSEYLARQGYSSRMLMNSRYDDRRYGGKEHQHIWVIVTSNLDKFDREFYTRNGYSAPIPGKSQTPTSQEPYPEDKRIEIKYLVEDTERPMNMNTNFIKYVNDYYPGNNFTEETSYYLYQDRSNGKNLNCIAY